jgi:hypothetical protein
LDGSATRYVVFSEPACAGCRITRKDFQSFICPAPTAIRTGSFLECGFAET